MIYFQSSNNGNSNGIANFNESIINLMYSGETKENGKKAKRKVALSTHF